MIRHRALLASLLLLAALVPLAFAAAAARHVVLISIDGLRPEFYLDDAYAAPDLRALVKTGSHASGHAGVPERHVSRSRHHRHRRSARSGVVFERIGLVDVAPTAARLLGLMMVNVDGRVLTEILP